MKKLILSLALISSIISLASEETYKKLRADFKAAGPMSLDEIKKISNENIMCFTVNSKGNSDIVESAINIKAYSSDVDGAVIIKNESKDLRWNFRFDLNSTNALGVKEAFGKFQPIPFYKSFRKKNKKTLIVEWSHRPYTVDLGHYGAIISNPEFGYDSDKSVSLPHLVSRNYSYCRL